MEGMLTLLVLTLILVAGWWLFRGGDPSTRDYENSERARMPDELARGRLMISETYWRTDVPRKLGARFDQVFLTPDGRLVPVDTKRRRRTNVTYYDQIEVSVQGAVLRHGRPGPLRRYDVAHYGYLRVVREGLPTVYLRFDLLTDGELESLVDRYHGIQSGAVEPRVARSPAMCRKCAYRADCPTDVARVAHVR